MLDTFRQALGQMRQRDFFQGAPGNRFRMTEAPVTNRISQKFETALGVQERLADIELHYDYQKNAPEFQNALGEAWPLVARRYTDLFSNGHGSVRPDLCLHNPLNVTNNRLAIEIKCGSASGFKIYHDLRKLRLYTDPNGLHFDTALFLHIRGAAQGPIETLRRWAGSNPRRNIDAQDVAAQLARADNLATPAPVRGARYYVWSIPELIFNDEGTLDLACIQEEEIRHDYAFGDVFLNQDYPLQQGA